MPILIETDIAPAVDLSLRPTQETYDTLQQAYDDANWALFDGGLPNCLITLQRRARTMGYFSADRFTRRDGQRTHELALNPSSLRDCTLIDSLSVVIHEMIHAWQQHHGHPGRGRYHNREFADKSKNLGLHPSSTGEKGGKETGDSMSHYIIEGGPFERFAREMIAKGFDLTWMETPPPMASDRTIDGGNSDEQAEPKAGRRVRYICPRAHKDEREDLFKAWARDGAELKCAEHDVLMEPG